MLFLIGLAILVFGGWWLGAMYMIDPDHASRPRLIGSYMIGVSFVGIGLVIVFQI